MDIVQRMGRAGIDAHHTKRCCFHILWVFYIRHYRLSEFKVDSGEYKMMGLAPYAENPCSTDCKHMVDVKEDGSFRFDRVFIKFDDMTNRFHDHWGRTDEDENGGSIWTWRLHSVSVLSESITSVSCSLTRTALIKMLAGDNLNFILMEKY